MPQSQVMGQMNKSLEAAGTMKAMQEFARQQEMAAVREEMLDEVLADAVRTSHSRWSTPTIYAAEVGA